MSTPTVPTPRSSPEEMTDGEKRAYIKGYVAALNLVRTALEILPIVDRRRAYNVIDAIKRGMNKAAQTAKGASDVKGSDDTR